MSATTTQVDCNGTSNIGIPCQCMGIREWCGSSFTKGCLKKLMKRQSKIIFLLVLSEDQVCGRYLKNMTSIEKWFHYGMHKNKKNKLWHIFMWKKLLHEITVPRMCFLVKNEYPSLMLVETVSWSLITTLHLKNLWKTDVIGVFFIHPCNIFWLPPFPMICTQDIVSQS